MTSIRNLVTEKCTVAAGLLLVFACMIQALGCAGRSSDATELAGSKQSPRRLQVKVASVKVQRLSALAEFTGNLLPRRRTSLVAEVDGIVDDIADIGPFIEVEVDDKQYREQLGIVPGQEVRRGDILVQLDPTDFQLDVAVAEAKLAKAEADLAKLKAWQRPEEVEVLQALVSESEARHKLAAADYQRAASLAERAAVSQSELEEAAMQLATSRAALASQQASLRQAKAGPTAPELAVQEALVKQAESELEQDRRQLAKTSIRAPFDGVVSEIAIEEGDHVTPSSGPLLELLDLRFLVAEVGVPESYIGMVHVQDRANVSITGAVEPVAGLVVSVNDKVDPESRSFRVRVAIDNQARRFKAGQFARVSMNVSDDQAKTTVPSSAITFLEGQPGVFVYDDGLVRRRTVTLGMSDESNSEILLGLTAGESVVVEDPNLLTDGMRVDVKSNDS